MDSKQVQGMMEAYASIYEKKCVDKKDKGMHNCAKKVCHEEYGEGETIFGQHAVPDENGFVSHYNVQFEHGIVENVSAEDLTILEGYKVHENHEHEGEMIDEGEKAMGQHPGKSPHKATRDKYETESRRATAPKGVGVPDKSKGYGGNPAYAPESVDVFDVIKGHLIDEGYANTEEAALVIMANMSEEWRTEIIEGIIGQTADNIARTVGTAVGTGERAVRELPGYLTQKVRNVKRTFDSARERASSNNPDVRSGRMVSKKPTKRTSAPSAQP